MSTFKTITSFFRTVVTNDRPRFREAVREYLESVPAIEVRPGVKRFVRLDSADIVRGLFFDCYHIGYFLTEIPGPVSFGESLARQPGYRKLGEPTPAGVLFAGGFDSNEDFGTAKHRFEEVAKKRYRSIITDRPKVASCPDEPAAERPVWGDRFVGADAGDRQIHVTVMDLGLLADDTQAGFGPDSPVIARTRVG